MASNGEHGVDHLLHAVPIDGLQRAAENPRIKIAIGRLQARPCVSKAKEHRVEIEVGDRLSIDAYSGGVGRAQGSATIPR